jgi:hypothetical protein
MANAPHGRDSGADPYAGNDVTGAQRTVTASALAKCPFSVAQDYATDYLRRAQAGSSEAQIRVPLGFLPAALHRRVAITFGLHFDVVEAGRAHDEIRVRWTAGTPVLPDFRGTLRFRIASGTSTTITLDGTYRVPFGQLGAWFDRLAGSRIAQSSAADLTARIARALERDQRDWRARVA